MRADGQTNSKDLKIVMVDVEGGAAVLFKTPEGKSLLIDTGWAPRTGGPRPAPGAPPPPAPAPGTPAAVPPPTSADRIAAAAKSLGITKIDYLLMTHYHADHLGGLETLLAKLPVDTFIDHGPNQEQPPTSPSSLPGRCLGSPASTVANYPKWVAAYSGHNHIVAKVGQKLDIGSLHLEFVTSDGEVVEKPLPGAGQPNAACAGIQPLDCEGGIENVLSLGMVITFGKTRILDLGDLTWNMEVKLLCPVNKVGPVDVYFVTGHGMNLSSSPATIALDPLVALMQNGATKGGDQEVINTVRSYPDLGGLWASHYSVRYPDLNGDLNYIANLNQQPDEGYSIGVDVTPAGEITVTNSRNNFSKTYKARGGK
jgi:beta-lactamase superfamily II metal-dependent hydrolase